MNIVVVSKQVGAITSRDIVRSKVANIPRLNIPTTRDSCMGRATFGTKVYDPVRQCFILLSLH